MRIVVMVKQVPDMERVKFDQEKGTIDRKSAGTEMNPFDLNALEAAVQVKEELGAEVVAISMGPPNAEEVIKESIARGADHGVLLSDRRFGGSDVKATSNALAYGIKTIEREYGKVDLVICGMQTVDGDTGQVGPEVAEFLNIPHIAYVEGVERVDEESIDVVCDIWEGVYVKKLKYPGLLTVTKSLNNPRLPSFKNKMAAKKYQVPVWNPDNFGEGISEDLFGSKGSPTRVRRVVVPKSHVRAGKVWREDFDTAFDEIIKRLGDERVLEVNNG